MIHISKMSGKLEGLRAISTNTTTNDYCIKQYEKKDSKNICTFCYSQEMLRTYRKNMAQALQRNTDIISKKVIHEDGLPIILDAFFRFNAHGELINEIKYRVTENEDPNDVLIDTLENDEVCYVMNAYINQLKDFRNKDIMDRFY